MAEACAYCVISGVPALLNKFQLTLSVAPSARFGTVTATGGFGLPGMVFAGDVNLPLASNPKEPVIRLVLVVVGSAPVTSEFGILTEYDQAPGPACVKVAVRVCAAPRES
ncbi:MAG: hypothetical protein WDO73_04775 [Ignavibacteriota bacterium]